MLFYRLLAMIDILFVSFVLRVILGELKVLDEASPISFVIFLAILSLLMLIVMFISNRKKTVTYKGKEITITNEDKMFIKLIRNNDYKVSKNLEKLVTHQDGKLAKMTSFMLVIALFIRITQLLRVKINLSQNLKLTILIAVLCVMLFVGLSTLFSGRNIKYNIILPYYKNLMVLETIEELNKEDSTIYFSLLKKCTNVKFDKDKVDKLRKEIKEGNDRVSILIDLDKNTNLLL